MWNLPSRQHLQRVNLPSRQHLQRVNLPSRQHLQRVNLPSRQHLQRVNLPSRQHLQRVNLPSRQHLQRVNLPSRQHLQRVNLPSRQHLQGVNLLLISGDRSKSPSNASKPEWKDLFMKRLKHAVQYAMSKPGENGQIWYWNTCVERQCETGIVLNVRYNVV